MRFSVAVVFSLWFIIYVASEYTPVKIHCDMVAHLSKKPYVERSEDLLGGLTQFRLVTVGITDDQIQNGFHCQCERMAFDPLKRQPHPPSCLLALWQCGPISLAQFIYVSESVGLHLSRGVSDPSQGSCGIRSHSRICLVVVAVYI